MHQRLKQAHRGKTKPTRIQKCWEQLEVSMMELTACDLQKLVLPLTMIGWRVSRVRTPANQDVPLELGCGAYLCCNSSSTDLRRLLFVRQKSLTDIEIAIVMINMKNKINKSKSKSWKHISWNSKTTLETFFVKLWKTVLLPLFEPQLLLTKHTWNLTWTLILHNIPKLQLRINHQT